jgi:hypothetical protein
MAAWKLAGGLISLPATEKEHLCRDRVGQDLAARCKTRFCTSARCVTSEENAASSDPFRVFSTGCQLLATDCGLPSDGPADEGPSFPIDAEKELGGVAEAQIRPDSICDPKG